MSKKINEWAVTFGRRIKEVRRLLGIQGQDLARELGITSNTYYRNEGGQNIPDLMTFVNIAQRYNISLDWLLLGRGEAEYKAPVAEEPALDETVSGDIKEMVQYMQKIPSLRHELLMHFYKYKEANPAKD